jgi:hypothetical protein
MKKMRIRFNHRDHRQHRDENLFVSLPRFGFLSVLLVCGGCGGEPRGAVLSGGREVSAWVKDLGDRSAKVRRVAVIKLGNVGDGDPVVVESLMKALDDSDAVVRRDAIMGIVKFKNPTAELRDKLEAVSKMDKDATIREHAAQAVARITEKL